MGFNLGNLLQQYLGGANANTAQAADDFDRVTQNAPRETVAQGVTQALRSDQTPPFPQMVGQMFSQGNPDQRAGMINQLLSGVAPSLLSSVAGGTLGHLFGGGQAPAQVTPEQAAQVSPEQVQEIAAKAEQHNPDVVNRIGNFTSAHPNLVKAIGGAALAIALGHIAQGIQQRH
jgi:predicted Zn-dependent peptidase